MSGVRGRSAAGRRDHRCACWAEEQLALGSGALVLLCFPFLRSPFLVHPGRPREACVQRDTRPVFGQEAALQVASTSSGSHWSGAGQQRGSAMASGVSGSPCTSAGGSVIGVPRYQVLRVVGAGAFGELGLGRALLFCSLDVASPIRPIHAALNQCRHRGASSGPRKRRARRYQTAGSRRPMSLTGEWCRWPWRWLLLCCSCLCECELLKDGQRAPWARGVRTAVSTQERGGGAAGHRRPASTALAGSRPHAHRAHCLLLPALVAEQALHVVRGARDPTPGLAAPPFHRACVRGLPDAASGSGRYAFVWHRPVLCRAVPCRAVLRLHARIRGVHRAVREARQKSLPQCLPSGALQHLAIAMEFGDAGSLLTYLQRQPGRRLAGQNARWLFQQLVIGLSYTHHRVSGAEGAVWLVQRRVDAGLAHIVCHVALCPASGVRRLAAHAGRRLIGQRVIARAPQCGQR